MNKQFTILLSFLTFMASNFQVYSTALEDEPNTSSSSIIRSASSNLRYYLGGGLVLASQLQTAVAKQAFPELDGSNDAANSTCAPCICPPASSATPADFLTNNAPVVLIGGTLTILLLPKIYQKVISPGVDYVEERFFTTTIDDMPIGDPAENVNIFKRIYKKAIKSWEGTYYPLFQLKLRDYQLAGLKSKVYKEIKLIDHHLSKKQKGWSKKPIYSSDEIFHNLNGFSYENGVVKIEVVRYRVGDPNANTTLPAPQLNQLRTQVWADFADPIHDKNPDKKINGLPDKVYHSLKRLALNKEGNETEFIKNGDQLIINYIKGISIVMTKNIHD